MNNIYRIVKLGDNKIKNIHIFRFEPEEEQINQIFPEDFDKNKELIGKYLFNIISKINDKDEMPDVFIINESIHEDDTIYDIKRKIISSYNNLITFEEIYLFGFNKKHMDNNEIFEDLTQNTHISITKQLFYQFLSNFENINTDNINLSKNTFDFNDIIQLKINNENKLIKIPFGQKMFVEKKYQLCSNPFDVVEYDSFITKYSNNIVTTNNNNLLLENDIYNNTLFLCLAKDVFKFNEKNTLPMDITTNLYFPFLSKLKITNLKTLKENHDELLKKNEKIIDKSFNLNNEIINMFYNKNNTSKVDFKFKDETISALEFELVPENNIKIPVDIIFKLINTSEEFPYIKFNPGYGIEDVYRLYTNKVSNDGRKIPILSKAKINNLNGFLAKPQNSLSIYYTNKKYHNIESYCTIEHSGRISIIVENLNKNIRLDDLEFYIKNGIATKIDEIYNFLKQKGYTYIKFEKLSQKSLILTRLRYQKSIELDTKIIGSIKKYMGCLSSLFNIIDENENEIELRFKRVPNYDTVDSINILINDLLIKKYSRDDILERLMSNYSLSLEDASLKYTDWLSFIEVEKKRNENKKIVMKKNPGFLVKFFEKITASNVQITIVIDYVNNFKFIPIINMYINSLIDIISNSQNSYIEKLCTNTSIIDTKTQIQDIDRENVEFVQFEDDEQDGLFDLLMSDGSSDDESSDDETDVKTDTVIERKSDADSDADSDSDSSISLSDFKIGGSRESEIKELRKKILDGKPIYKHFNKITKLNETDEKLFVKSIKKGKNKKGQITYDSYSRICPETDGRQPIAITKEELDKINKENPGSYENVIKYGSSETNQNYYICPRYWCLLTNTSLTKEQVDSGVCGGIIPSGSKTIPEGKYVLESNLNTKTGNNSNYIGFIKNKKTSDGQCLPCCFNKFGKSIQENIDRCIDNKTPVKTKLHKKKQREDDAYIMSPETFPLKNKRWGYMNLSLQIFFDNNNTKCYSSKNKSNQIKLNSKCLLRYGVENNQNQSFISCLADIYNEENMTTNNSNEMRQIISDSITLESFVSYFSGSLINIFAEDTLSVDHTKYKKTKIYKKLLDINKNKISVSNLNFFKKIVSAYENFKSFLTDLSEPIDYTYLWDIVSSPNNKLFKKGLNLVILNITENDMTNNIEIICPTNSFTNKLFDANKPILIITKRDIYYEPIYLYEKRRSEIIIKKTFSIYDSYLPENLKKSIETIKKTNTKCKPLESMPTLYKAKNNKFLPEILRIIDHLENYVVSSQILNYNNKVIGLSIYVVNTDSYMYLPIEPSSLDSSIDYNYIYSIYDNNIWGSLHETYTNLTNLNIASNNKIPCKPLVKVIENELVVGLYTETNQFVMLKEPEENIPDLQMDNVFGKNYMNIDKKIMKSDLNKIDTNRAFMVKKIKLENNFYNAFRNTLRILLNNYNLISYRKLLHKYIVSKYITYTERIQSIYLIILEILNKYVNFSVFDDKMIDSIDDVISCIQKDTINNNSCVDHSLCISKNEIGEKTCQLILPKNNLISGMDNETLYYFRIADELIRFGNIREFIFKPKVYLSIDNVEYNLHNNEIILLKKIYERSKDLNDGYMDNLIPIEINKYVKNTVSDFIQPQKSQLYENTFDFNSFLNKKDKSESPHKNIIPMPSKISLFFSSDNKLEEFGFDNLTDIIGDTEINIRGILYRNIIGLIDKYDINQVTKKIYNMDNKYVLFKPVLDKKQQLYDLIMSDSYKLTNIDIILLSKHFNLPVIIIDNSYKLPFWVVNKKILKEHDKYYFIYKNYYIHLKPLEILKTKLISSLDTRPNINKYFENIIKEYDLINITSKTKSKIKSQEKLRKKSQKESPEKIREKSQKESPEKVREKSQEEKVKMKKIPNTIYKLKGKKSKLKIGQDTKLETVNLSSDYISSDKDSSSGKLSQKESPEKVKMIKIPNTIYKLKDKKSKLKIGQDTKLETINLSSDYISSDEDSSSGKLSQKQSPEKVKMKKIPNTIYKLKDKKSKLKIGQDTKLKTVNLSSDYTSSVDDSST
jgi:hypothetical protein